MITISKTLIIEEAKKRGWSVTKVDSEWLLYEVIDTKGTKIRFNNTRPVHSSANGYAVAVDKALTLTLAKFLGIQTPPFVLCQKPNEGVPFLSIHKKVVVKPYDGEKSQDVTMNVTTPEELKKGIKVALSNSANALVQVQLTGKEYRMLVVAGTVFAVAERVPAFVIGNGKRTIQELVDAKNAHPLRSTSRTTPFEQINTEAVAAHVGKQMLLQVLPKGKVFTLLPMASISTGGEARDVTDITHSFYKERAERIARSLDLTVCGVDIITSDIRKEPTDSIFPLLEINSNPGISAHHYPAAGKARNAAGAILDATFA